MDHMVKKRDWKKLITLIQVELATIEKADLLLKNGVQEFCQRLQVENIISASVNTSGTIWGAKSIIMCFCEVFDPILETLFTHHFYTNQLLKDHQVFLPLAKHFKKKEMSMKLVENIRAAICSLEKLMHDPHAITPSPLSASPLEWETIERDGESLELLARVVFLIHKELANNEIIWCSICFRVANELGTYCELHSSKNDTNYRKGLRVKSAIPEKYEQIAQSLKNKRIVLKDDVIVVSSTDVFLIDLAPESNVIVEEELIESLVKNTKNNCWLIARDDWAHVLNALPYVRKRLDGDLCGYASWESFVDACLVALENTSEKTTHPYWIYIMLIQAELWLATESKILNEDAVSKKDKVLDLISKGLRNCEIVKQHDVSNSYVSELRKAYNKNRTCN